MRLIVEKRGLLISPPPFKTHCYCPIAVREDNKLIVLYSSREYNKGKIYKSILDINQDNLEISSIPLPVLKEGEIGTFAQDGVAPSAIIKSPDISDRYKLYYFGFQHVKGMKHALLLGDEITTSLRYEISPNKIPKYERTKSAPYIRSALSPIHNSNEIDLFIVKGEDYIENDYIPYTIYKMNKDEKEDSPIVNRHFFEFGISRPYVFKHQDIYICLFSARGKNSSYRLGCSISRDKINWKREDDLLQISETLKEDSEMMCFPYLVPLQDNKYILLYNGNNHGEDGVLWGTLEIISD